MSYIDAYLDKKTEKIRVVERTTEGNRVYVDYKPDWHFYIEERGGKYKSIFGKELKKIEPVTKKDKLNLLSNYKYSQTYESDINPVVRCLEQEYKHKEPPNLHVAFFDIEVDFDKENGYSSPEQAFNKITSISIFLQWANVMVCLAIPPSTMSWEDANKISSSLGEEVMLFNSEREMLRAFLNIIEDADIISGWNSQGFDIPYIVNRITIILDRMETRKLCLWGELPKSKKYEKYGKEQTTYDLIGRVHLDYLDLYKKYTYEERHSYTLNSIAEIELGEKKVEYEGSLDQLYNNDFKLFLEYNIQDTALLDKLDKKLQYISLANAIAHQNCVLLPTTMGSVATIDQAIIMEAHDRGMIVPDKKNNKSSSDTRIAGGWVSKPKKGMHEWIGSIDLNSLYPSMIRSLNMSPETVVGQIDLSNTYHEIHTWEHAAAKNTFAGWWNDRFWPLEMENYVSQNIDEKLTLSMETGDQYEITGAELNKIIFEGGNPWCISANGTIFRTDIDGIIPGLLTRWYSERKALQKHGKDYKLLIDSEKNKGIKISEELFSDVDVDDSHVHANPYDPDQCFSPSKLKELIREKHKKRIMDYMNQHNLITKDGKIIHKDQEELKQIIGFWDKRQLVRKILLNSLYGSVINEGSRFFDQRIGQSTTLTGRNVTRHMTAKTNELITGKYDHYGESIIYNDTDSVYFSAYSILIDRINSGEIKWDKENVIKLYDGISDMVNDTFVEFMQNTFNVPPERSTGVVAAGREIVASTGLFIKKKRYACMVYDKEGERKDIDGKAGSVKAMGLDLRRSDTPKMVQEFLMNILTDLLTGHEKKDIIQSIRDFKKKFRNLQSWEMGTPKAVNNLTTYKDKLERHLENKYKGKQSSLTVPGHVMASINWNLLRDIHNDKHSMKIMDGQKVIVCKLRETTDNTMTSIAYPVDEVHLPDWFMSLPFDQDGMIAAIIDKKIENLLGVLNWDLSVIDDDSEHVESLFDFSVFD